MNGNRGESSLKNNGKLFADHDRDLLRGRYLQLAVVNDVLRSGAKLLVQSLPPEIARRWQIRGGMGARHQ